MHADRLARRDGLLYATMPLKSLLVIREYLRESAVMLFSECLNETALPRIDTNLRQSLGAAQGIVVYDHPNKEISWSFARIRANQRYGCSVNSRKKLLTAD
jgi:hypothetical protein